MALRIPFMQMRTLKVGGQKTMTGSIINVPNNLEESTSIVPRPMTDTKTVRVMFMRQMKAKHAYMKEVVRPKIVYEAAKLLTHTPLYQQENVILSSDWEATHEGKYLCIMNNSKVCFTIHLFWQAILRSTLQNLDIPVEQADDMNTDCPILRNMKMTSQIRNF